MRPLNLICVWKLSPNFKKEAVLKLRAGIERNISMPFRLIVLTDSVYRVETEGNILKVPLLHDYPGNWSKIELFRPDIRKRFYPALFFDLVSISPLLSLISLQFSEPLVNCLRSSVN